MSTQDLPDLPTIAPAALAQVSGGGTRAAAPTTSTSNDQVLTTLTGILDSIKTLSTNQTGGGFNQTEMIMLMMIMQQRNQAAYAAASSPWPWSQEPIIRYY